MKFLGSNQRHFVYFHVINEKFCDKTRTGKGMIYQCFRYSNNEFRSLTRS